MQNSVGLKSFFFIEFVVVFYILSTTGSLPQVVASHFNGVGVPNGFMSNNGYLVFMLVFAAGIPAMVVGGISAALRVSQGSINIPNREFWLAPERKQETLQFLNSHIAWLGSFIALFIAYVHWLLLRANAVQPVQLPTDFLFIGMGVFLVVILVWGILLPVRFMRLPK